MVTFVWAIFSVLLESIDGLRLDHFLEGLAFVLPNFMVRTLIIILIQSFLQVYWTLFFMVMVIGSNALLILKVDCFSCLKSVLPAKLIEMASLPDHKNKIVSVLVSFPLSVLVSEDITKKERGELEPEEERRQAQKYLSVFSITNMTVFLPLSYVLIYLISSGILQTDHNVILSVTQLYQIFLFIALPLAVLAFSSSLLLLLSPWLNDKLKIFLQVVIIATTIIYPTTVGVSMIEKSPTSVLIFVKQQECVHIFQGRQYFDQEFFDLKQSWTFANGSVYSENKSLELQTFVEKPQKNKNILYVSFEMDTLTQLGENKNEVYIEESTEVTPAKLKRLHFSLNTFIYIYQNPFYRKLKNRKVCLLCAHESNLCKRIRYSLTSDPQLSDADCECVQGRKEGCHGLFKIFITFHS